MVDDEIVRAISYIKRSKNRYNTIMYIANGFKMPSEIAKALNLRINQISALLSDLKKENIVVCINEHEKVGRIYKLTNLGLESYNLIKDNDENY